MKRIGVAGIIKGNDQHAYSLLMGRRGKEPNQGLYVLPGGGVEDGESLEEAFCREVLEETGLEIETMPGRWKAGCNVIELEDRIILVQFATARSNREPKDGSDLYDVQWFPCYDLPSDMSPVVIPTLALWGFLPGNTRKWQPERNV